MERGARAEESGEGSRGGSFLQCPFIHHPLLRFEYFGDLTGLGLLEEVLAVRSWELPSTSIATFLSLLTDAGPVEAVGYVLTRLGFILFHFVLFPFPPFSPHLSCLLHSIFGNLPTEMKTWGEKKHPSRRVGWGEGGDPVRNGLPPTPPRPTPIAGRKIFLLRLFLFNSLPEALGVGRKCFVKCVLKQNTPHPIHTHYVEYPS